MSDIGCSTVSYSATPTFAASASNCFEMTLTGNVTSSTLSGETAGQTLVLRLTQDGSGGHTFTYPAEVTGGCTIASTANATTEVLMVVNSSGVSVQGCRALDAPDSAVFGCADPANVETPPSGSRTLFCDSTKSNATSGSGD